MTAEAVRTRARALRLSAPSDSEKGQSADFRIRNHIVSFYGKAGLILVTENQAYPWLRKADLILGDL
jgi:hypothetical protein